MSGDIVIGIPNGVKILSAGVGGRARLAVGAIFGIAQPAYKLPQSSQSDPVCSCVRKGTAAATGTTAA